MKKIKSPFVAGTGLLGATEPGQVVTKENAHHLPPGSVVQLPGVARLIHLHDDLWLRCSDSSHCYDWLEGHLNYLPGTLCHIPRNRK